MPRNVYFLRLHREGLTLLEIIVALSILVIAILGFYSAFTSSQILRQLNTEKQIAMSIARQKMEEILAENWELIPGKNQEQIEVPALDYPKGKDSNGRVIVDSTYINQNILQITIVVEWQSLRGPLSINLSTFAEKK